MNGSITRVKYLHVCVFIVCFPIGNPPSRVLMKSIGAIFFTTGCPSWRQPDAWNGQPHALHYKYNSVVISTYLSGQHMNTSKFPKEDQKFTVRRNFKIFHSSIFYA